MYSINQQKTLLVKKFNQFHLNMLTVTSKQAVNEYYYELNSLYSTKSTSLLAKAIPVEYFLNPILNTIKKIELYEQKHKKQINDWSDTHESLLKSTILILNNSPLLDELTNLFNDILNINSLLLTKNNKFTNTSTNEAKVSEEFLCVSFQLTRTLFTRSSPSILNKFYVFNNLTTIGLLVSLFLDKLVESSSLLVRLEAISSLMALCNANNSISQSSDLNKKIGVIFASFLPGLSIKLLQNFLLTQNLKILNHKLICASIDLFANVIAKVLGDELLDEKCYTASLDSCLNLPAEKLKENVKSLIVDRREKKEWTAKSSEKIFVLIERLFDQLLIVSANDNYHVKMSLVRFCVLVLDKCYVSLNAYADKLIKVLIMSASNDDENNNDLISSEARKGIALIENKEIADESMLTSNADLKFVKLTRFSILNICLEQVLLKLPRIMQKRNELELEKNAAERAAIDTKSNEFLLSEENNKLNYLKTFYGYLSLIDNYNLREFFQLNDLRNLNYLLDALISCIVFEYNNLENFFQVNAASSSTRNSSIVTSTSNYEGLLTFLSSKKAFTQLTLVCSYIGKSNLIRLVIDQLLFNNFKLSVEQNEILFIVNLLMQDIAQNSYINEDELFAIINLTLTNFLVDRSKSLHESSSLDNFISNANRFIIYICLNIELIRICSVSCVSSSSNNRKFINKFLIDTLYFLLENFLSKNLLIKAVCVKCLNELAVNLSFRSIQELLGKNFDYIMNDLILKINKSSRALSDANAANTNILILCSLIDISNFEIMFYLDRLVEDMFFKCEISPSDFVLLNGLCSIMLRMAKSIRKWYPINMQSIFVNKSADSENNEEEVEFNFTSINFVKVANFRKLKDYNRLFVDVLAEIEKNKIKLNNNFMDHDHQQDSDQQIEEELESGKKELPMHVKLQVKCLEKCQHFISHPDKQIRLRVIEIIRELSKNLANEYENEFLPLVHKLWSPILQRFNYDDLVVKIRIIYLLFDLSVLCGDFLNDRFIKEFLKPRLAHFMHDQAKSSLNHDSTYIYTNIFKLQASILTNVDKMCILFDVKELDLEFIIEMIVLSYLDKRQPKKLLSLAIESLRNLSLIDSDVVWLSLHYVLPFKEHAIRDGQEMKRKFSRFIKKKKLNIQFNDETLKSLFTLFNSI